MTHNGEIVEHAPLIGRRRWIQRKRFTLGGSKRKTKRREQRAVRQQIADASEFGRRPDDG
jgi:hypothetical protein